MSLQLNKAFVAVFEEFSRIFCTKIPEAHVTTSARDYFYFFSPLSLWQSIQHKSSISKAKALITLLRKKTFLQKGVRVPLHKIKV
jgi:hypothetical protein